MKFKRPVLPSDGGGGNLVAASSHLFCVAPASLAAPEPAFRLAYADIGKTDSFLMVNACLNKLFLFQNGILIMKKGNSL